MGRYRTINVDLNRQYRNDLNANFAQIEQDILAQENFTVEMKNSLLTELARIEQESKDRDNALAKQNLEVLLQSIEDAKANANTSATNANLKAAYAEEQGNYAKAQGDYAKSQGDYASTKGDYANEKAVLADEAASNANLEASNLSALKVAVVDATQSANNAKTNADTATTNANNAAAYAITQGDYAKQQAERAQDIVDGTGLLTDTDIGVKVAGFNSNGQVLDKNGNVVEGKVKSVNGVVPDDTGNIPITIPTKTSEITNDSGFITISSVTKTQVGLGSVQNYGVATQAEAEAGTSTSKYMTPQRVAQAISKLAPNKASQIAIDDVSNLFTATNVENALSELFTNVSNGKNLIATAITGKGVSASGGDTFAILASKIGQISTGKKFAVGLGTTDASNNLIVRGLNFEPAIVIAVRRTNSSTQQGYAMTVFNHARLVTEEFKPFISGGALGVFYVHHNSSYTGKLEHDSAMAHTFFSDGFSLKTIATNYNDFRWIAFE